MAPNENIITYGELNWTDVCQYVTIFTRSVPKSIDADRDALVHLVGCGCNPRVSRELTRFNNKQSVTSGPSSWKEVRTGFFAGSCVKAIIGAIPAPRDVLFSFGESE